MGFSVSGSAAIIFLAAFVSIGILYTSAYNSFERVEAAADADAADLLEQQNTDIEIRDVTNTTIDSVTITVENTGSTTLRVDRTDVLLNGTYQNPESITVDGESADLWAPGETVTIDVGYEPSGTIRVTIVSGPGVSAFQEVRF